jgi:uncharacterized protein YjiK
MRRFLSRKSLSLAFIGLALVAAFLVGREYRVVPHFWFKWQAIWQPAAAESLRLQDYQVVIDGRKIDGLHENVSALSYDPDRKSLFTVTNKHSELIELSLDGKILRRIALVGFGDAEAVEYISAGVYVISDEYQQRLIKVRVNDQTQTLDAADAQQLTLSFGGGDNNGFEGLAYDAKGQRLFVAKERKPMRILEVHGFPGTALSTPEALDVRSSPKRDARLPVRDLSSLMFDERSGHLFALSHESKQILEMDTEGRTISAIALTKGALGLSESVPQAEGIAMDDEGTLYLVSEPNLFYSFRRP